MEEKEEKKVNTEELKSEASNAVNEVKDTIKNVDIKKDTIETKSFITEMFKDPLGKIKEMATKNTRKYLTYSIIMIVIWTISELIYKCFSLSSLWGYSHIGNSILSIIIATLTPILSILVMTFIIFIINTKNKKSLTTIITLITTASIPLVIASVVNLLILINSQISIITIPISKLCYVTSIILMYFTTKSIFNIDKNSEFIKKFIQIQGIYYIVYIVLTFFKIYI